MTIPVLSAQAVREAEQRFPQLLADGTLMQRAAAAVAAECLAMLRASGGIVGRHVLLLVGSGDNGGDALFAGARLARRGVAVFAVPVAGHMHAAGETALRAAGGRVVDSEGALALFDRLDLVLDGIVGLGSTRALAGDAALLAQAVADAGLPTLAIDLPSGVHVDTGAVTGPCVRADVTVTFGALRRCHVVPPAAMQCGEVLVADIGVPMDGPDLAITGQGTWFASPHASADKYSRGVVGIATGSPRYPGAALLSTGAALRSGCGLVRYFGAIAAAVVQAHPEVVVAPVAAAPNARCQAWLFGCGSGTDEEAVDALAPLLLVDVPVVLDADALSLVARDRHLQSLVRARAERGAVTLLTPHAGELQRLADGIGLAVDLEADRLHALQAVAVDLGAVVLLKGPATLIGDGQRFIATPLLGAQLATAGSGDVLAGLIAGAIARWQAAATLDTGAVMHIAAAAALRHASAAATANTTAGDLLVGLAAAPSATMSP